MTEQPDRNAASIYAALHVIGDVKRKQGIHVLMPYVHDLQEFGRWYRQLWAESLGKKYNRGRDIVYAGPTPIAALGATDQHSQIQLYMEGPPNKIITFIETRSFRSDLRVPPSAKDLPGMAYLASVPLAKILHAERAATAEALRAAKRPNGTLVIPAVNPETVGALFQFFAIATAMAGELYEINTYDQPGVETGKRTMNALLGKPGTSSKDIRLTLSTMKPKVF
jgi:glucose-6-phosphate isomerase